MLYSETNQTIYNSIQEFQSAFPNTSFGELYEESYRNSILLFNIVDERPEIDFELQVATKGTLLKIGNKYIYEYSISPRPLLPEEYNSIMFRKCDLALTNFLDQTAQAQRWDNRITLAVRAGYPNPWQQLAIKFGTWMDQCNTLAYQYMEDVKSGAALPPSSVDEFLSIFPAMDWEH